VRRLRVSRFDPGKVSRVISFAKRIIAQKAEAASKSGSSTMPRKLLQAPEKRRVIKEQLLRTKKPFARIANEQGIDHRDIRRVYLAMQAAGRNPPERKSGGSRKAGRSTRKPRRATDSSRNRIAKILAGYEEDIVGLSKYFYYRYKDFFAPVMNQDDIANNVRIECFRRLRRNPSLRIRLTFLFNNEVKKAARVRKMPHLERGTEESEWNLLETIPAEGEPVQEKSAIETIEKLAGKAKLLGYQKMWLYCRAAGIQASTAAKMLGVKEVEIKNLRKTITYKLMKARITPEDI